MDWLFDRISDETTIFYNILNNVLTYQLLNVLTYQFPFIFFLHSSFPPSFLSSLLSRSILQSTKRKQGTLKIK